MIPKLTEILQAPINMDHVTDDYKEDAAEKLAMWQKLVPLKPGHFQHFWDLLFPDVLMTDLQKAELTSWDSGPAKREGMKMKDEDRVHGVVRQIRENGDIQEFTCNDDKLAGLYRWVNRDKKVIVQLWKER